MKTLLILLLSIFTLSCVNNNTTQRLSFTGINKNGDLIITYKGETVLIELEDEQSEYYFSIGDTEYSLTHYRSDCEWVNNKFDCDNYVIFHKQLYAAL